VCQLRESKSRPARVGRTALACNYYYFYCFFSVLLDEAALDGALLEPLAALSLG